MRGVLHGFLGTYVSRYSDYEGYLLFGFLQDSSSPLVFDLLQAPDRGSSTTNPRAFAATLAAEKFSEQVKKAGLERSMIREAILTLEQTGKTGMTFVNGQSRLAQELTFSASVVMDNGRQFRQSCSAFVARHDPATELRSGRARDA